ncbi:MAG TPA: PilZ domain-containing protein [Terriglobales bacterium]|nr:PilZ domain-containing protein [Terriglobales bacterium]
MNQGESGPDQRRWTRHRIDARLKVTFQSEKGPTSVFGRANILGQGGMGVFIPASIPVGANVSLEVSFPYSPAEVRLEAVVRNGEGFRYGLEFLDVREEVRNVIVKNCGAAALLQ